jgi:hypothetical protein
MLDRHTELLIGRVLKYLATAVVALVLLAGVAMAGYVIYYYLIAGLLAKTSRVPARILRKRQSESGQTMALVETALGEPYALRNEDDSPNYRFFLVFDVYGKEVEFAVPESVYAEAEEGDTGQLVHKGNLFKRFISDKSVIDSSTGNANIRKI